MAVGAAAAGSQSPMRPLRGMKEKVLKAKSSLEGSLSGKELENKQAAYSHIANEIGIMIEHASNKEYDDAIDMRNKIISGTQREKLSDELRDELYPLLDKAYDALWKKKCE